MEDESDAKLVLFVGYFGSVQLTDTYYHTFRVNWAVFVTCRIVAYGSTSCLLHVCCPLLAKFVKNMHEFLFETLSVIVKHETADTYSLKLYNRDFYFNDFLIDLTQNCPHTHQLHRNVVP